jgi:hypothetical protein
MPLPDRIRVKLSSEAAEAISLTRVVVQEMPLRELVEHMLAVTGKDRERIRDFLRRGTLVSGASRFRWEGWESSVAELDELLAGFPDPEPARRFDPRACTRAVLRGEHAAVDIPREAGLRRGLFRRANFWDGLMQIVEAGAPAYQTYSYRDQADVYRASIETTRVQQLWERLKYSTLREQVRRGGFDSADLFTSRAASAARQR